MKKVIVPPWASTTLYDLSYYQIYFYVGGKDSEARSSGLLQSNLSMAIEI